ncbi:MAG: hypothetical protein ACI8RZ_004854 [Myxococcota bacterium]|jgi:hypothetical protein
MSSPKGAVMRSGQKKNGADDGGSQRMGEGGPFGIESPEAEKTEGRAGQVGKIKSRDGRSRNWWW